MGCGTSSSKNSLDETIVRPKQNHPLVSELASPLQKIRASEAIKKNDSFLIKKTLQEITPLHNLGLVGENYTCLHVAAQNNAFYAMEACIAWLKANKESEINSIMSIPGPDDYNPVVRAITQDASETFYVMLREGVIPANFKDGKGQTIEQICRQHSFNCLNLLQRNNKGSQPDQKEETPITQEDVVIHATQKFGDDSDKEMALRKLKTIVAKVDKTKSVIPEDDLALRSLGSMHADLQGIPPQSQVYKILNKLIKTGGELFLDSNFPPNLSSILADNNHEYMKEFKACTWKRPHELFASNYDQIHVFDNIDPGDISQGILGVCYLLSSLSALTEFPSRLTPIYINKTANKYGLYGLKLYVKGVPTEIIVDDHFPCYGDRKCEPMFSKPKGKELWVLLAEKAWAKLYKNYIACEAGFMDEALEYLLGCPSIKYLTKDQDVDKVWDVLTDADNNNHILCAATHGTVKEEMGLIANHAYSLISTHHINNYRILKLRNPWGKFEWKGNFGDNSKLWTNEMKSKVGYVKADDGVFFMTVEDFKKNFEFYSIGIYNEGWEYSYVEAESDPKHAEYFKFTVDQPCSVYFRVHQSDQRNLSAKEQETFEYASGDLVLARVEDDGTYKPILDDPKNVHLGSYWGARSIFPTKNHKLHLSKPGEYIIRTKLRWRNGVKDKFTLSAYAPIKIELQAVKPIKDFLSKMLKNVGQVVELTDKGDGCKMASGFYSHYLYIYLENNSRKKWTTTLNFDEMDNLRLRKPYLTQGNTMKITVPPGQRIAAYAKKIDVTGGASYSWTSEERKE